MQPQAGILQCVLYVTYCIIHNSRLYIALQEQSLVDIAMPGQYMNGEEPSQEGIVFLEGISANVHVSKHYTTLDCGYCRAHIKDLHVLALHNNHIRLSSTVKVK